MPPPSATTIATINILILTAIIIQILRSRIEQRPRHGVHATEGVGLALSCIAQIFAIVFFHLSLGPRTSGRSFVAAATALNITVLAQMLIWGLKSALYTYLVNGLWCAEIAMVAYALLYREAEETGVLGVRKPLLDDVKALESHLDRIEKRIMEIRALARKELNGASA